MPRSGSCDDALGQLLCLGGRNNGPSRLQHLLNDFHRAEAEEELDLNLTCLLSSKWIANDSLSTKQEDALLLQSMMCGPVPATVPARAMSTPLPVLPPLGLPSQQSVLPSCTDGMWPDDALPPAPHPTTETPGPPEAAKILKSTPPPSTCKDPKRWQELREKRRKSNRDSAKRVKLRQEHKFAELRQEVLQLRQDKEGLEMELVEAVHQRDTMARKIPNFVKRCKMIVTENSRLQSALSVRLALSAQTKPSPLLPLVGAASSVATTLKFGQSQAFPLPPSTPDGLTRPASLMSRPASEELGILAGDQFLWEGAGLARAGNDIPCAQMLVPSISCTPRSEALSKEQQEAEDFASLLTMPFT